MKKISLIILVSLVMISFVLAVGGNNLKSNLSDSGSSDNQNINDSNKVNIEAQVQNKGELEQLQNQLRVNSGEYKIANGEKMQIQLEEQNKLKFKVGDVEAKSNMQISSEYDSKNGETLLKTQLSNGRNADVKIMPNTASQNAIERLQLKICNSENNCSIELKEVGNGNQTKVAYEVQAQKEAKVLGMFKTKMQVKMQIDAETGETIQTKRPWWSFLASE